MNRLSLLCVLVGLMICVCEAQDEPLFKETLDVNIPHVSTDPSVKIDYDIVYVRADRAGDKVHKRFYTDFSQPVTMEPGADLMLLHPDGSEEVLVDGGKGSVTDPVISFDGEWVYYSYLYDLEKHNQWSPPRAGADIFKLHLKTRKVVRLTDQTFTPNTGAADWSSDYRKSEPGKTHFDYGVFNMGPCPLPGGRIAFTSNRDGFRPSKGYPTIALQLFVMDDSDEGLGQNVEKIGHLNIAGALHPVALKDGRIMFSTLESQGIRSEILWGLWTIHPDGTNWAPLISAFDSGGAPNGFHFQTQLSDGSLVVEEYYNQNNSGFGSYIKLPPSPPEGYPAFGPAFMNDSRNKPWRYGRHDNGKAKWYRIPFMPTGSVSLTPFALGLEGPADPSVLKDKDSPKVGKFTHPSAAPENHLLTVYSPGPVNHQYTYLPQLDGGLYLLKNGEAIEQPAYLRRIKNDPNYNECWPRAVVPYSRIYGMKEPNKLQSLANDGSRSKHLPEGTPFGLVGSSSLYKRESYPNGVVREGEVTATYAGGRDPWRGLDAFTSHGNGPPLNWHNQGADVGLYSNDDIHAIRILAMEPTTDRNRGEKTGRHFFNHASERFRILGEIPVRKFAADGSQPRDPDGNPDTSFLAKIPADTAFTFQTLDQRGLVLNSAQTWHQLRPGEIRHDCGGCHAHSQKPTEFSLTAAAKPDYAVWDLVNTTPLLTSKTEVRSPAFRRNAPAEAGTTNAVTVEYFRDIQPILKRSCIACHTKSWEKPAGNLVLDADDEQIQFEHHGKFPGTYLRLAMDERAKFGHKPIGYDSWGYPNASRYIRKLQSRRSLLVWKIYGERLDGFSNDDHPSEPEPGAGYFALKGDKVDTQRNRHAYDLDYLGGSMPPPDAVAGKYRGPDGQAIKVEPLSDEDRRTIVRWIDLGCPIDFDYDADHPEQRGLGWMLDDNRPILTLTSPQPGANGPLTRILIGMHDYDSGLDVTSLDVRADFGVNGIAADENLASKFQPKSQGVWELKLAQPLTKLSASKLTVAVRDRQGHWSRIDRRFRVGRE
ncbi:MAG: hypothetical protein IAG10_28340 [Planctomycetaceae bacterium]|nr:hypothetical protein [Planctomycetaceae bacterium]